MLHQPPRTRESADWFLVAAWLLVIYTIIPFARAIQAGVEAVFGRAAFAIAVYAAVVAGVAALAWFARRARLALSPARWLVVAAVAAAYGAGTWHLRRAPEEAMHFVEYGVLSLLIFRAFTHRVRDPSIYLATILLGALLGVCDEIIQWITPRRFWDLRDVAINATAGVLMQAGLAFGVAPPYIAGAVRARSVRLCRRLAVALLLVLLACVSNTPARMRVYQPHLPFLNETMSEYGSRYEAPGDILFFSRLTPDRLHAEDEERAEEAGAILRREGGDGNYERFVDVYSPRGDPFLHEMRVHLFRRDRYWRDARAKRGDPADHARLITIACREQTILETYFGRTLAASGLDWPADLRARAFAAAVPGPYASPVSHQIITRVTERQLQAILVALLLVALLAGRYYEKRAATAGPG